VRAVYAVPVPEGVTVPPEAIVDWAQGSGIPARAFATPAEALAAASAGRQSEDVLVVAGSLYLVAAVRSLLRAGAFGFLSEVRESR
jgi:dihydrofolate synthase/folylpolyglutamate synthase